MNKHSKKFYLGLALVPFILSGCGNNPSPTNPSQVDPSTTSETTSEEYIYIDEMINFEDKEYTYDGKTHSLQVDGLPKGVTVTYENNDKVDAGTYTVKATFTVQEGYKYFTPNPKTATLTIKKAEANITFEDKSFDYDGKEHSLEITGTLPTGVSVTYENNKHVEPGSYEVTATFSGHKNYDIPDELKATLTINKAASEGLVFTYSSSKGGYIWSSIGTCTDEDIIVPEYTPTGEKIIAMNVYDASSSDAKSITLNSFMGEKIQDFESCGINNFRKLINVYVKNGNPYIDSISGVLHSKDHKTIIFYPNGREDETYTISEEVEHIAYYVFSNNYLVNLNLPDGLLSIDEYGIYGNSLKYNEDDDPNRKYLGNENNPYLACVEIKGNNLSTLILNENTRVLKNNPYGRFSGSITELTFPASLVAIPQLCCYSFANLQSVTIPESVEYIFDSAFYYCEKITSITLPKNLKHIGSYAFSRTNLSIVEIPDTVETIGSGAFYYINTLETVKFPTRKDDESLFIGDDAFSYTNVKEVSLSGKVHIGYQAFYSCSSLTSVTFAINGEVLLENNAFMNCDKIETFVLPNNIIDLANLELNHDVSSTNYLGAEYLGNEANPYLVLSHTKESSLEELKIHDDTKFVLQDAFDEVTVNKITFGNSVEVIYDCAFAVRFLHEDITLPDSLVRVGNSAFNFDYGYGIALSIGKNLKDITPSSFDGTFTSFNVSEENPYFASIDGLLTSKDKTIAIRAPRYYGDFSGGYVIPESITEINEKCYYLNERIEKLTIPSRITKIGEYAFSSSYTLKELNVETTAISGVEGVFRSLTGLTKITLCEGITELGEDSFNYTMELKEINFPASLKIIGNSAFSYGGLTKVNVPAAVEEIGSLAFANNTNLISAEIRAKKISNQMFYGCSNLVQVIIGKEVTELPKNGYSIFGGSLSADLKVYLEKSPTEMYPYAFGANRTYYYSETEPTDTDYKYWHYVNNVPTIW